MGITMAWVLEHSNNFRTPAGRVAGFLCFRCNAWKQPYKLLSSNDVCNL
jgi:hypothetical protein